MRISVNLGDGCSCKKGWEARRREGGRYYYHSPARKGIWGATNHDDSIQCTLHYPTLLLGFTVFFFVSVSPSSFSPFLVEMRWGEEEMWILPTAEKEREREWFKWSFSFSLISFFGRKFSPSPCLWHHVTVSDRERKIDGPFLPQPPVQYIMHEITRITKFHEASFSFIGKSSVAQQPRRNNHLEPEFGLAKRAEGTVGNLHLRGAQHWGRRHFQPNDSQHQMWVLYTLLFVGIIGMINILIDLYRCAVLQAWPGSGVWRGQRRDGEDLLWGWGQPSGFHHLRVEVQRQRGDRGHASWQVTTDPLLKMALDYVN